MIREKMKKLSERLTNFLKRKRTKLNVAINITESETQKELGEAVVRELERFLKDARGRKMIQRVSGR